VAAEGWRVMAKRKFSEPLYRKIEAVLESARAGAYRAVNAAMVRAYWQVGQLIVEHEQGGAKGATYGEAVLDDLSQRLTADFGRGFDVTNLRKMRQFYRLFEIRDAARLVSGVETIRHTPCDELSWSHYRLPMQVENPAAREWYMREAADQHWSTCHGRTGAAGSENSDHLVSGNSGHLELRNSKGTLLADTHREGRGDRHAEAARHSGPAQGGAHAGRDRQAGGGRKTKRSTRGR